jgi:hypothetical protein
MMAARALWLAAPLATLLAACAGGPPPPTEATTALPPAAATERLEQALTAEGVDVARQPDGLRVTTSDPRFVRCLPVNVRDSSGDSSRNVFTQVSERRGVVDVRVASVGDQTRVTWQPRFTGRYHNRVNNSFFDQPCESTGELESLLAQAVAA